MYVLQDRNVFKELVYYKNMKKTTHKKNKMKHRMIIVSFRIDKSSYRFIKKQSKYPTKWIRDVIESKIKKMLK